MLLGFIFISVVLTTLRNMRLIFGVRCETIFWHPTHPLYIDPGVNISGDILTPGSIYLNDILTPFTIFLPPSHKYIEQFCWLCTITKCGVFYIYIVFMNSERIGLEQVYQNKIRWSLVSCFNLQLIQPFITLWNHVLVVKNESIINTEEIINMILIW